MVKEDIMEALKNRKDELTEMLNDDSLQLEKQHQIYGAINEIDMFLKTLDYYDKSSQENSFGKITLVKPPKPKKDLFSKILDDVKSKVKIKKK